MTPNIAFVQIEYPHWHNLRLWLPLFLLWIPVILLAPILLLVVVVVSGANHINPWRAIAAFWAIVCSLPGTDVHVRTEGNTVRVKII